MDEIPTFNSLEEVDTARVKEAVSLALVRPKKMLRLEIKPTKNSEWTEEEKEKLLRDQMQGNLFDEAEIRHQVKELRKIPFDFYYWFLCDTPSGEKEYRQKIVDWEAGALFWNCQKKHGRNWEKPFRDMLESQLGSKDLMFLLGNQHRFQDQWLIISLIYPPKQQIVDTTQGSLF